MKKEVFWSIALVAFFGALIAIAYWPKPKVEAKPQPCVASQNEMCPPQAFLSDYDEWKALNDKIEGSQKKEKDLRSGWASRLNESMPPGYYFDVDSRKFHKREIPQPV